MFDGIRSELAANRSKFFRDLPSGPFYGFNRDGATVVPAVIDNWWRQGMTGSAKARITTGSKAFSETDQTDDLKAISVPTLVLHGDDDQIIPYKNAALLQAEILPNATLKIYEGFSHGMLTVNADVINPDLLAFRTGLRQRENGAMKIYLVSLGAGLLAGLVYGLIGVRSPAPPIVALVGLAGILLGEQIVPLAKRLADRPELVRYFHHDCAPQILGTPTGKERDA